MSDENTWMEDNAAKETKTSRSTRKTREKETRVKQWQPPSSLDAPPPPEGFAHRWIREELAGTLDSKNISARIREGYELVRADEYPDFHGAPVVDRGRYEGVIGVGGLLLARIPVELLKQRAQYYREMVYGQEEAVNSDLLKENVHSTMRINNPERQTRISFGGRRGAAS